MLIVESLCLWRKAMSRLTLSAVLGLGLAILGPLPAQAGPGDIHQVTNADVVNLRAGPSNESNVRGTVERGDEVIELTRENGWIGVRVLRTGEEGWVFGDLLEPVARTTLRINGEPAEPVVEDAGFLRLSESFNQLIRGINANLGYPVVQQVDQPEADLLRVVPSQEWLINGSREAHLMAAAAMYQMWKNHQDGAPVRLQMADEQGRDYITIVDGDNGPDLSIVRPERG
jgi:uncharacterized protein YgiM (DUF1202 family)